MGPSYLQRRLLGAEQGFTLIELLVAMLTAVVVVGALFAIFDVSLHQETSITDKVQADQIGRSAMTSIMEELHSSCTGFGATAIQVPSTKPTSPLGESGPANLWFLSAYGSSTSGNATPTSIAEHDINWTSTGTSTTGLTLGTLTDYSFTSTASKEATKSGEGLQWEFPSLTTSNAKAKVLATDVVAPTVSGVATLFQYYTYNNNTSEATDGQLNATPVSTPLSTASTASNYAGSIAKVTINFTQAPRDGDTRQSRSVNLSDEMVLRFSPTTTGEGAAPCE